MSQWHKEEIREARKETIMISNDRNKMTSLKKKKVYCLYDGARELG